jgi:hypothetical protein
MAWRTSDTHHLDSREQARSKDSKARRGRGSISLLFCFLVLVIPRVCNAHTHTYDREIFTWYTWPAHGKDMGREGKGKGIG